jgi:hypothetical protein
LALLIRNAGFQNIGVVHGKSTTGDRARVINHWKSKSIDIVVGTSAFGLGIDVPDVRAVIHCCVPENVDRYYQEIGRIGRDNRSATAVIIPSYQDVRVAQKVGQRKVISIEKGLPRWKAMFETAERRDVSKHRIYVDATASPSYEPDMKSGLSQEWNFKVLNLMARTNMVRYAGLEATTSGKVLIALDILDQRHAEVEQWEELVEPLRARLQKADSRGYQGMLELLRDDHCHSLDFSKMYTLNFREVTFPVTLACGGCRTCRVQKPGGWFADWPLAPEPPWSLGNLTDPLSRIMHAGFQLVEYAADEMYKKRMQRVVGETIDALWRLGLRKFIILGDPPAYVRSSLERKPWAVLQSTSSLVLEGNSLPSGPEAIWVCHGQQLTAGAIATQSSNGRLLITYENIPDPRYHPEPLNDRQTAMTLDALHEALQA